MDLTETNLRKLFIQIIDEQRKVQIQYEDKNGDFTNREIYPISLIQGFASNRSTTKAVKVVSYCKLREDYRTFLLSSIDEILVDKKIPQAFIKRFNSLGVQEKNNILDGTNFYGSYNHDPIKTIEDPRGHEEIKKTQVSAKPVSRPQPKPKGKSNKIPEPVYREVSNEKSLFNSGWFWFLAFYLFLIFINS